MDDAQDQHHMIGVRDFIHDSVVADSHSKELVLGSLDGLDQLAGWARIPGQSVDCPFETPAFRPRGALEGSSC